MTNHNDPLKADPFSAAYTLIRNARVMTHAGKSALMDEEMHDILAERFGFPFLGTVEATTYEFVPERAIPADTVAVPEANHNDPSALLIQK